MTKRLSEILAEARQVVSVEEQIEDYLNFLSTLTEEEIEEEIESLDELSKHTLGRYIKGAGNNRSDAEFNKGFWYGQDSRDSDREVTRNAAVAKKRKKGMHRAVDKMTGRAKVNASEEVENIDELSKKTLGSYVKKASREMGSAIRPETSHTIFGMKRAEKRMKGIGKAVDKLTREETETLNLGGYQPVPGAEKNFVSKHKVQKHADPAGNGDDVFKGSNIKKTKHTPNEKIKEDITEAKAVSPTLAAKRALQGVADSVGKNKEGHLVARREFFYRHGGTSEKFAGEVSRALTKAGVKHTVVDHNEHWAPFRGGASVKSSSHWAAHIKVHDGE